MLIRTLLNVSLLAGMLPLTSHAQTAPASSRFYVGVGANLYSNVPFKDRKTVPRLLGPSLTVGMQFTPRLAGQAGLSYHWQGQEYSFPSYSSSSSTPFTTITERSHYIIAPVLLRYTLTTSATNFHVDVLGGATLLHAASHATSSTPAFNVDRTPDTRVNLTLGPALRATISSHLELTVNGLVSMRVGKNYYEFSDRLFLNTSLGVNYTFD
jgi:hypothetical protein